MFKKNVKKAVLSSLLVLLVACAHQSAPYLKEQSIKNRYGMVVTANPHATLAGAEILRAGGSAVDAAIAIEAVLTLVEPQSSGLAGGSFMLHYDQQTGNIVSYNGRETAPAAANKDLFLDERSQPLSFLKAKNSGLSTGVPGVVAMLQMAHQEHGRLPWNKLFNKAQALASEGFEISPRLHYFMQRFGKYLPKTKAQGPVDAYNYFYNDKGQPYPVGHILKNPAYAETLTTLAESPADFYQGKIAEQIIQQVQQPPRSGSLTLQDFKNYRAKRHQALCSDYRAVLLCGPPPPSSWVMVAEIAGILEQSGGFSEQKQNDPQNWAKFAQAQRLAYADQSRYIADPDFILVPTEGLLSPLYHAARGKYMSAEAMAQPVNAGDPWLYQAIEKRAAGIDATRDVAGTSHFVVVDAQGDVVSMTASVESVFGSTRMAGGMFLNNQLTDFSFKAVDENGRAIANAAGANKRPRSSMSPTIVLDKNGQFLMATGSPGGRSIIAYTAKTLIGVLDWGLSPQQAIDLPNLVARGDVLRIEKVLASEQLINGLRSAGFTVDESSGENSGLSTVLKQKNGLLIGGADKRREGVVELIDFSKIANSINIE